MSGRMVAAVLETGNITREDNYLKDSPMHYGTDFEATSNGGIYA